MSVLSDVDLLRIFTDAKHTTSMDDPYRVTNGLRAVADAAIAADRAARAEPVGQLCESVYGRGQVFWFALPSDGTKLYTTPPASPVVPEDMSPANVPMYWMDESSNACAYAAGFNACRRAMLAAAPAPTCQRSADPANTSAERVDVSPKNEHDRRLECHWRQDDDVHMPETWDGACGAKWSFIDGGPVENEMHYCPNCGGRVSLAAAPAPSQEPTK